MSIRVMGVLALGLLGGCGCEEGEDERVTIPSDAWSAGSGSDDAGADLAVDHTALQTNLIIDRETSTVTFETPDADIEVGFEAWPESDWPSDCEAGCSVSRVEVLSLNEPVSLGDLIFEDPAVFALCGEGDPAANLVLAEAPEGDTGSWKGGEADVYFHQ